MQLSFMHCQQGLFWRGKQSNSLPGSRFLHSLGTEHQVCSSGPQEVLWWAAGWSRVNLWLLEAGGRDKEVTRPVKLSYSYALFLHWSAMLQIESLQHCRVASWVLGQPAQEIFSSPCAREFFEVIPATAWKKHICCWAAQPLLPLHALVPGRAG